MATCATTTATHAQRSGLSTTQRQELRQTLPPDTIGQYTGLKDINGKEIYEGDIVAAGLSISLKDRPYGFIKWHPKGYFYIHTSTIDEYQDCIPMGELAKSYPLRVLGNIFDNPEMMKGGEK